MSHTSELGNDWIAIHDGDYAGEVLLQKIERSHGDSVVTQRVTVPSSVLLAFAAEAVRSRLIRDLENKSPEKVLGLR